MSASMRFAVFLAIALAVWLVQHIYVGWRLWPLPAIASAVGHRAMVAVLVAGFLSYPLGRILYAAGWHAAGRALEYAGAVWMGTLFLLFASLLFVDVVTLGGFVLRPWVGALRTAAVALSVVAAAAGLISARLGPRVVRLEVPMATLPQAADGLTIAHLSDVHLGTILGPSFLERLIGRTRALEPDLVVITGDLVDGDAGVVEEMVPQMRELRAPKGVFAVLGNHEFYAGRDRSRALLEGAGFSVLDNASEELVPGLFLAGVPDARGSAQTGPAEADLEAALAGVGEDAAVVLLQHAPEAEARAAAAGVGLMLNGHTHGGQLWPFHYFVQRVYPHLAGVYRVNGMTQVVSRGSGQWGPPMRFLAPSEIYLITLRSGRPASPPASAPDAERQ
ncbi:MAG TPA: metallophosphoesterase [Thermoanaerobaculales bacterium]|nr:metallophosphoesterase [Thermoanaerobaculales bacterium]HPA82628.1 metallophosphoesterase [Thermoanaerobaculales bacterium]HQN95278.1 metallophosphoesterase [Thermoanaerobaculales bacterium]